MYALAAFNAFPITDPSCRDAYDWLAWLEWRALRGADGTLAAYGELFLVLWPCATTASLGANGAYARLAAVMHSAVEKGDAAHQLYSQVPPSPAT